jgi:hypothetical protein
MTTFIIKTIFVLSLFSLFPPAISQTVPKPVQIIGMGMHYGGKVIYNYQIKNNGTKSVNRILLGFMYGQGSDYKMGLDEVPFYDHGTTIDEWHPSTLIARPEGWGGRLIAATGEGGEIGIEWIEGAYLKKLWPYDVAKENAPIVYPGGKAIGPGQTVGGFSVTLDRIDYGYITKGALVEYGDSQLSIPIEKGDPIAPTLNVTAHRRNDDDDNGRWAVFVIEAVATDNYDPLPDILLEPITSNQPMQKDDVSIHFKKNVWKIKLKNVRGRIYQMPYSATDASGNKTVKTVEYNVNLAAKEDQLEERQDRLGEKQDRLGK